MDRKHFCSPPLAGLIILAVVALAIPADIATHTDRTPSGYEREIRKKNDALDSIRSEIDLRRKKIHEFEKAEGTSLSRLQYLEANIAASKKYLLILSARIDTAESTISFLNDSLDRARMLLANRQKLMKERLRRAYMAGAESPLMQLFMAHNPADPIHQSRYLEAVRRYDQDLVEKIEKERQVFNGEKDRIEAKKQELADLLKDKEQETAALIQEETSRRGVIRDIRAKKKDYLARIAELESAGRQLNAVIRNLESRRRKLEPGAHPFAGSALSFERQKGALPWPVDGPVVAPFGTIVHPVYKTVTFNNGIDIGAEAGTPVNCIASGIVLYTGSMRGLGRLVIVDHGSGYLTIYANLEKIEVSTNQIINAGAVVGLAGGWSGENGIQVHFEIRKSNDALDPAAWLGKR